MICSNYSNTVYGEEGFPFSYQTSKAYVVDGKSYSYEYMENGKIIDHSDNNMVNTDNWAVLDTYATYREKADYVGAIFENPLKNAIQSEIKTVKFDGIDCYSIKTKDKSGVEIIVYFEKETGLLRKLDNQEYYNSFNTVNDKIFTSPEGMETQEAISDTYIVNFTR